MTVELAGQRVVVVGLGKSGMAAARLLAAEGARVVLNDARSPEEHPEAVALAEELGAELALGGHEPSLFLGADRIVVSPGVPPLPALRRAEIAGVPIASEIELASRFVRGTVIGITGTNGKSTVTSMVGAMCEEAGRATFVGGNLGTPLVDVVGTAAASEEGILVVELSSFQLERVERFRAHIAALLNVTADHLDRYPTFEAYAEAKAAIFEGQERGDVAIVPDGDELCLSLASRTAGSIRTFGGHGDVRVSGDRLVDMGGSLSLPIAELRLRGGHNLDNAAAAALIGRVAGLPERAIVHVLQTFGGLPHRMEHVATVAGVDYLDDSKATNVGASIAALSGFEGRSGRVVLIAGGKDKGGSYAPLRRALERVGRGVVLIGEAAPLLARAFMGSELDVRKADDMDEAVGMARSIALEGDTVLLAPACASFDMFRSYAERGKAYQAAVSRLEEGRE